MEWCPTKQMVADFMTKPLQGTIFKKFRDLIMGLLPMDEAAKLLTRDACWGTTDRGGRLFKHTYY